MSKDLVNDIRKMHDKFGVTEAMKKLSKKNRAEFLKFRIAFLDEELSELKNNSDKPEEIVDALIDLSVVSITTLEALGVDTNKAWNEVQRANMAKNPGVNPSSPNPLGLPDMIKPEGWKPPSHEGNHGMIVGFNPAKAIVDEVQSSPEKEHDDLTFKQRVIFTVLSIGTLIAVVQNLSNLVA